MYTTLDLEPFRTCLVHMLYGSYYLTKRIVMTALMEPVVITLDLQVCSGLPPALIHFSKVPDVEPFDYYLGLCGSFQKSGANSRALTRKGGVGY